MHRVQAQRAHAMEQALAQAEALFAVNSALALKSIEKAIGLIPTKGIPLPLISYGGSAVVCTLVTFGLLLSVSDRATSR